MQTFITGTDTDVGKTIVSSWLCLHTGYSYFKPIQTGCILGKDSCKVRGLTGAHVYKEAFVFEEPLSPHLAALRENRSIDINEIKLPQENNRPLSKLIYGKRRSASEAPQDVFEECSSASTTKLPSEIEFRKRFNLIIEGAGGVLAPINEDKFMVDLIKKFATPVILVARSTIGTINHTLLSLEALRARNISVLGVILNGPHDQDNFNAIEFYGKVQVLASIPKLQCISKESLMQIPFSTQLRRLYELK